MYKILYKIISNKKNMIGTRVSEIKSSIYYHWYPTVSIYGNVNWYHSRSSIIYMYTWQSLYYYYTVDMLIFFLKKSQCLALQYHFYIVFASLAFLLAIRVNILHPISRYSIDACFSFSRSFLHIKQTPRVLKSIFY